MKSTDRICVNEFGFEWGAATIACLFAEKKTGHVTIGLETPKGKFQISVTKTGQVRIFELKSQTEWKPEPKEKHHASLQGQIANRC